VAAEVDVDMLIRAGASQQNPAMDWTGYEAAVGKNCHVDSSMVVLRKKLARWAWVPARGDRAVRRAPQQSRPDLAGGTDQAK
jgi:hypothetical protein